MSSNAVRDMTNASPSKASSSPASPPIKVDRDTRRTSLIKIDTRRQPKISGATRQPTEFIPNTYSPAAINHLPSCGWTTKDAPSDHTSGLPATIELSAFLAQLRS